MKTHLILKSGVKGQIPHLQKFHRSWFLHFEARGPTKREMLGPSSMMTPLDVEAWVKGQIWHLLKIC